MTVSLENLANLKNGSYYLSDNGEIKKAGLWTKFKYAFNLGHSKQRAVNLVNEIKHSLFLAAGSKGNQTLDEKISEFNFDSGVKSSDIKSLLSTFKQANQSKILSNSARSIALEHIKKQVKILTKKNPQIKDTPEIKDLFLKACKSVIDNPAVKETKNGQVIDKSAVFEQIALKVNALQVALTTLISVEGDDFYISGGYATYLEKTLFNQEGELVEGYTDYVLGPEAALLETIKDSLRVNDPDKLALLDKSAEYLASQVGIDPDLDNILFKQYSHIMRNSAHEPRSLDEVKQIVEGMKNNIEELSAVHKLFTRGHKVALSLYSQFEGNTFPKGILPKLIEFGSTASIDRIIYLGDKPSLTDLYKAFSYLQGRINEFYNENKLNELFKEPGQKVVIDKLIFTVMLSNLEKEDRTRIVNALGSADFFRFNTFCNEAFNNYEFPGSGEEQNLSREYLDKVQSTMNDFKSTLWALRLRDEPRSYNYTGDLDRNNETSSIMADVYETTMKLLDKDFELYTGQVVKDDFKNSDV